MKKQGFIVFFVFLFLVMQTNTLSAEENIGIVNIILENHSVLIYKKKTQIFSVGEPLLVKRDGRNIGKLQVFEAGDVYLKCRIIKNTENIFEGDMVLRETSQTSISDKNSNNKSTRKISGTKNSYLPLNVGNRWEWVISGSRYDASETEEIVEKKSGNEYVSNIKMYSGAILVDKAVRTYKIDNTGIYIVSEISSINPREKYDKPCLIFPSEPRKGFSWKCENKQYEIIGFGEISNRSGNYKDCIKVKNGRSTEWHCNNVGLVRIESEGSSLKQELKSFTSSSGSNGDAERDNLYDKNNYNSETTYGQQQQNQKLDEEHRRYLCGSAIDKYNQCVAYSNNPDTGCSSLRTLAIATCENLGFNVTQ